MRPLLLLTILMIVMALGILVYRSQSAPKTQVTPDAKQQIDKAKGR